MRIIAGRYRGRIVKAAPGERTRPTTDRIREAWASTLISLLPHGFDGLSVLDAFAGSGALGLEAVSRGAGTVVFCEKDHRALGVLRENLLIVEEGSCALLVLALDVFSIKAVKALRESGPYQLVVLDPPYSIPVRNMEVILRALAETGSLTPGAFITYEHRKGENNGLDGLVIASDCSPASLKMVSCKTYGTTQLEYLCYQALKEQ